MKRKLICPILLGFLTLLMIICLPVRAEPVASGTFGRSNLEMQWSFEGNTLYITGNGQMDGFSMKDARPWDPYLGQIHRIVMTGTIENIGSHMFKDCTALTEIVWPDGLKFVGNYAFKGCTSLKNVTIPETVEKIYEHAFIHCTALEIVTMSENVTHIGEGAFESCSALHTVKLSSKLREIGRWCFMGCTALQQIELPSSLQILGVSAFQGSGLVKITIPEQVQGISGLFSECKNLEEVTFAGESMDVLGSGMFYYCSSLTTVNLPAQVSTVHIDAFAGCKKLTSVNFYGDMPKFQPTYTFSIHLIIYYPEGNTTWTQEAMDALTGAYVGNKVQFVPTVYQTQEPEEPTGGTNTQNPTKQEPVTSEPTVAAPTEQTQSQESENAGNQANIPTDNAADNPNNTPTENDGDNQTNPPTENPVADNETEEPAPFPWVVVCIGAAVLLAAAGVIVWVRIKKRV